MARSHPLSGIIRWVEGAEWRDAFAEELGEHFGEVLEELDIEFDGLEEVIGRDWTSLAWTCAFEHFLTRPQDDEGATVVDQYLKRRGWKETATSKRYMEALRDSVLSLHLVSDLVPGKSFVLRDVVLGGDPVRIVDALASAEVEEGEHVAARVIEVSGRHQVSLGMLPMHPETVRELVELIGQEAETIEHAALAETPEAELPEGVELGPDFFKLLLLADMTPQITCWWLQDMIGPAEKSDDPDLEAGANVATIILPFKDGASEATLRQRLDAVRSFRGEGDDVWAWHRVKRVEGGAAKAGRPAAGGEEEPLRLGSVLMRDRKVIVLAALEANALEATEIIRHFADDLLDMPEAAESEG